VLLRVQERPPVQELLPALVMAAARFDRRAFGAAFEGRFAVQAQWKGMVAQARFPVRQQGPRGKALQAEGSPSRSK
jgi:hypothetical protein